MSGKTSTESKEKWKAKMYRRYVIYLRNDTDRNMIAFIEDNKERLGTTNIFREALEEYLNCK